MDHYLPYLDWLNHQKEHMKDLVTTWGNINSHTFNYQGLEKQLNLLKKSFQLLEAEVKEIDLPQQHIVDEHGSKSTRALGKALHFVKRKDAHQKVLFGGHMDTVYPITSKFQAVTEKDGKLLGPGVCDMKGGLVVLLYALQAFEKSPYAKEVGWEIIINPDEEVGSPGSHKLYEEAAKRCKLGLIFEPSHSDGSLVSSRAGSMKLSVVVKGKAAHAGRDFAKGRSALFAAASLITDLEKLNTLKPNGDEGENFEDQVIVNCGEIHSGHGYNIVPDLAVIRINVRAASLNKFQEVRKKIDELVKKHSERDGIWMEIHEDGKSPPKELDSKTKELIEHLSVCAKDLGYELRTKPSRGACDGNFLHAAGLSTIDALGPIGANIHTPDEFLVIDSLLERAKLVALYLMRLGAHEFTFEKEKTIDL